MGCAGPCPRCFPDAACSATTLTSKVYRFMAMTPEICPCCSHSSVCASAISAILSAVRPTFWGPRKRGPSNLRTAAWVLGSFRLLWLHRQLAGQSLAASALQQRPKGGREGCWGLQGFPEADEVLSHDGCCL